MTEDRAARLQASLEVLDAYVAAMDRPLDVLACISDSDTVVEAEAAVRDLLGVGSTGARAIMNLQFRRVTRTDRLRLETDRDEHRRLLAELEDS